VNRWTVELSKSAQREYRRLEEGPKRDAAELLEDLAEDPFSIPAISMRSHPPGTMRARFHHDRYRMVYQISKPERRVIVSRMRPRPIAYRGLKH
jgi:mRNA-degrading endonuclease RelE of RelBE toxin-antitoxin system